MRKPMVSVIVPVYNNREYLDTCIQSLLTQTYPTLEILLVDDGSTDGASKLCDIYATQYGCIRTIHQENGGVSFARAQGLRQAMGAYVMFVDCDDWIEPDTIECCVAAAETEQADCVLFGYVREYPNKSMPTPLFDQDKALSVSEAETQIHSRLVGPSARQLRNPHRVDGFSSMCMKLYRAKTARKGRFVSERVVGTSEDTIFNLYALECCRICCLQRCFYHYRKDNPRSITTVHKPQLAQQWDVLYETFQEYIRNQESKAQYEALLYNRVACGMIGLGLNEIVSDENFRKKVIKLRMILGKPLYRKAFAQLDLTYCGLKWRLFFHLCQKRAARRLGRLLQRMQKLRKHRPG